jgi:hypothetical protein
VLRDTQLRQTLEYGSVMSSLDRRTLLRGALGLGAAGLLPGWALGGEAGRSPAALSGEDIKLTVGHTMARIDGKAGHAVTVNGTVPGPLIRLKEGQHVRLSVTNTLDEDTSIHWHGLLVPFQMDGVPGSAFRASSRARPSPMSSRSGRRAPTGTTATRACRSRWATMAPSSSIRPARTPSP